ncbi:MAG: hypothetical protein ACYCQI_06110 [Gammaproteobacteria bacterium]
MDQSRQTDLSGFRLGAMQNQVALPYNLSLDRIITESWQRVDGAKATFVGALAMIFLIVLGYSIINILSNIFLPEGQAKVISFIIQIVSSLTLMPLMVGISYLGVERSVGLPIKAMQIFSMFHYFWRLLGLLILQYVMVYVLTFLFIITIFVFPSYDAVSLWIYSLLKLVQVAFVFAIIYISFSFIFAFLLIVEKRLGVFAAYKASFLAFSQHWFKIIVGMVFMFCLYMLSIALLLVGAIWIAPMFHIFHGILYRNAFGVEAVR